MSVQDVVAFDPIQANDIDAELERSLTNEWDAKIMTYPNERFPFNEWMLNRIRMMGFPVEDLSYFHEVVPQTETYRVTKQLCADTNLPEFRRMLNSFVRQVVVPKGKLRKPVAVQRYMNVRIMLPSTPELFFPLHTGLLYGHGIASRSLWMPFVDVTADEDKSRSMQIVPIKKSRELAKYAIEKRLDMAQMTEVWGGDAHQIKAGPGSCCLFSQEHIHGSGKPNITGKTRISMDFRIAEGMYGDLLGRKIPAGYFHLIPDTEEEEERWQQLPPRELQFNNGKQHIFYVANNTSSTYPHPGASAALHAVRLHQQEEIVLRLRAVRSGRHAALPDLVAPGRGPQRQHRHVQHLRPSGRGSGSQSLLETALKRGNIIHFVNEDLQLVTADDLSTIKHYLDFSKYGHSRLPIGLPLSDPTRDYFDKWSESLAQPQ